MFYTHSDNYRTGIRGTPSVSLPQELPREERLLSGQSRRRLEEVEREEGDIDTLLRSGRIEAIVHGLWEKMNSVSRDAQGSVQDVAALRGELTRIEGTIKDFAATGSVETLGAVVEEQRLRLDSLILGTWVLSIVSVFDDFLSC